MAIDNMISLKLSSDEIQQINDALTTIENVMAGKFTNLTPEERQAHARVSTKTEDWIVQVKQYMAQNPDLVLKHIDTAEFNADFEARKILLPLFAHIKGIYDRIDDTALLLGSDLYYNAITFYKGLKAAAATNALNAQTVYNALQVRFPGRPGGAARAAKPSKWLKQSATWEDNNGILPVITW